MILVARSLRSLLPAKLLLEVGGSTLEVMLGIECIVRSNLGLFDLNNQNPGTLQYCTGQDRDRRVRVFHGACRFLSNSFLFFTVSPHQTYVWKQQRCPCRGRGRFFVVYLLKKPRTLSEEALLHVLASYMNLLRV